MSIFDSNPPRLRPPTLSYRPRAEHRTPLPDDQQDSVMRSLVGHTTSGLQYGLDLLDKPGRAVRGLLAGKPRELGNLLPFSDQWLTDPSQKTSGRDLTNAIGLTDKRDKGWGASGLGLGAEILTDPLTYLTLGASHAATAPGKALAKIGATKGPSWTRKALLQGFQDTHSAMAARGLNAEQIAYEVDKGRRIATPAMEAKVLADTGKPLLANQPLGGLAGVGIPFKAPSKILGTGPKSQYVAGKLDRIGHRLKYNTTLGRWTNSWLDPEVAEAVGGKSQQAMANHGSPARRELREEGRRDVFDTVHGISNAVKSGLGESDVLRASRQFIENANIRPGLGTVVPVVAAHVAPELRDAARDIGLITRNASDVNLARERGIGLPSKDLGDEFIQHGPRHGVHLAEAQRIANGQPGRSGLSPAVIDRNNFPVVAGDNFARQSPIRDIPGGSAMVDDWVARHAGDPRNLGTAGLARQFKKDMALEYMQSGKVITRDLGKQLDAKAIEAAEYVTGKSKVHSEHGIGLFGENLTHDVARMSEQHARKMATGHAVMGFIGDNAVPYVKGSGNIKVSRVLRDLGFKNYQEGGVLSGALVSAHRKLAKKGAPITDPLLTGKFSKLKKSADRFSLTPADYDELMRTHNKNWAPKTVNEEPLGVVDGLTSMFKNLAYPLWPSSHARNAFSALLNNLSVGTSPAAHVAQFKLMRNTLTADEARKFLPSLQAGISDEAARDYLRREQFATGKVFDGHSGQFDLDNGVAARLQGKQPGQVTPDLFGADRVGSGSMLGDTARLIGGGLKDQAASIGNPLKNPLRPGGPLEMAGVFGGAGDNPALKTGRAVGSNIEDFFRGANFLGNTRAGMDTTQAGRSALGLHFDYDALTNTEKKWFRRAVPFYTFARKNLPLRADWLAHRPALTVAQMRAMNAGRDGEYLPDYLAGGAAIPTGPEVDGKRQYISNFGTPLEEAIERFKFKDGLPDVRGTAFAFGANLNPLVKGPIEQLFNTQFHTGRKLSDLRPPATASAIGHLFGEDNPQLLSQALVNTPFTRFITTLDRLIDSRKGLGAKALNLGTGVKVTDVDLDKAKAAEAAQARNEILAGMPHVKSYTNFYVKPGEQENLTPQEVEMLRMLASMQQDSRAYAKAQKNIGVRSAP